MLWDCATIFLLTYVAVFTPFQVSLATRPTPSPSKSLRVVRTRAHTYTHAHMRACTHSVDLFLG